MVKFGEWYRVSNLTALAQLPLLNSASIVATASFLCLLCIIEIKNEVLSWQKFLVQILQIGSASPGQEGCDDKARLDHLLYAWPADLIIHFQRRQRLLGQACLTKSMDIMRLSLIHNLPPEPWIGVVAHTASPTTQMGAPEYVRAGGCCKFHAARAHCRATVICQSWCATSFEGFRVNLDLRHWLVFPSAEFIPRKTSSIFL